VAEEIAGAFMDVLKCTMGDQPPILAAAGVRTLSLLDWWYLALDCPRLESLTAS